jgi:hypothetical protein
MEREAYALTILWLGEEGRERGGGEEKREDGKGWTKDGVQGQ